MGRLLAFGLPQTASFISQILTSPSSFPSPTSLKLGLLGTRKAHYPFASPLRPALPELSSSHSIAFLSCPLTIILPWPYRQPPA